MSSENRNSSAVRNLRSIFENKNTLDSSSPDSRGRSPSGLGSDKENGYRPTSKVRASFVPVEPAGGMAATVDNNESSAGLRREEFSEQDGDGTLSDLRRTISEQQNQRLVPEGVVESAAVTPLRKEGEGQLGHDDSPSLRKADKAPENPEKPVTGAEEEPNDMTPADPSNEDAVSGGDALPPVTEDLRPSTKPSAPAKKADTKKPTTNGKPAAISTKPPSKTSSSAVKSPASQPKTPSSAKASSSSAKTESPASTSLKAPAKKASRSSLTAPTAASMARSGAASDKSTSPKNSQTTKPKLREPTKPASLPSHLTAPTASSRAKHDPTAVPASTANTTSSRTSTTSRPKQHAPPKATSRSSLPPQQRPQSRDSHNATRKSAGQPNSSFLERMMKPTTSSSSKTHEKAGSKSPPRTKATAPKPKVNGHTAKKPSEGSKAAHSAATQEEKPSNSEQDDAPEPAAIDEPSTTSAAVGSAIDEPTPGETAEGYGDDGAEGNETPIPHSNGDADAALEATPAGLGGEETIR